MNEAGDLHHLRDELLRRVGRNVVNFQILEATLRAVIPSLSANGTLSELPLHYQSTTRRHRKMALGDLADAFHDRVLGCEKREEAPLQAPSEPRLSFAVQLELPPDEVASFKRSLLSLVRERNRLIHKDFLTVDFNSHEQCEAIAVRLDEQNARIRQQLEQLNSIRAGLREAAEDLCRFVESEEFAAALGGVNYDA